jgi:hypothetical protein
MNTQKSPKTVQEFQDQFKLIIGLCHELHKYKDVYYALCNEAKNPWQRDQLDASWRVMSQRKPFTKAKGLPLLLETCQHRVNTCVAPEYASFKTVMINNNVKNQHIRNKLAVIMEDQLKNPKYDSLNMAMGRKVVDHKTILQNIALFTARFVLVEEMKRHVKFLTNSETTLLEDLLWDYCYERDCRKALAYTILCGDILRYEEEVKKCIENNKHPTPPIPYVLQVIFCPELVTEKNDVYDEMLKPHYECEERREQEAEAEKKRTEERRRREETARLNMEEYNRVQQEHRAQKAMESEVAAMEESMKTLRSEFPHMPEIQLQHLAAMHVSCEKNGF